MNREKIVVRTSIIGIITNFLLATFKIIVGYLSRSIAIVLDAVNNFSDAGSSIITIIGTKLANKEPNKNHPFGYGRIEYLSSMLISIIILYAGITSFIESIKKIINPEKVDYSSITLIIISVAVIVKIFLGKYVKSIGKKVNSSSLINSGEDATLDSIISFSTLIAALIYIWKGISLEAHLGAIISIVIIKSGICMLGETISQILGKNASLELIKNIKNTVVNFDKVKGVYDLVLHNYGPENFNGSIHIEIDDNLTSNDIYELTNEITKEVLKKHNIILTAISVYSINKNNKKIDEMRKKIKDLVLSKKTVKEMHGFYVNENKKEIRFDLVISFDETNKKNLHENIMNEIKNIYPEYNIEIIFDIDFLPV